MNDLVDDGFHEIQLSGKQLVFLFMATTIVAVVIFLCGVRVGRGVKGDGTADQSDSSTTSVGAPPVASTLSQPPATGAPAAGEPPAPAQEPLTYPQRLRADSTTPEKLKSQQPATPASSAPHSAASSPSAAPQRSAAPPQSATPPAPVAANPPAPAATSSPNPGPAASHGQPGSWIVQVTAIQDRSAAAAIVKRLTGKGYPAFVLDPVAGSPVIYRVQVGGYDDRGEADQVRRRLEKDEQYKPLVRAR